MDKRRTYIIIECTVCNRKGAFTGCADVTYGSDDDEIEARRIASGKAIREGWRLDPCLCERCIRSQKSDAKNLG